MGNHSAIINPLQLVHLLPVFVVWPGPQGASEGGPGHLREILGIFQGIS